MEDTVYFYIKKLVNKVFFFFDCTVHVFGETISIKYDQTAMMTQLDSRKGRLLQFVTGKWRVNATSGGHVYWGFKKSAYFLRTNFQAIISPPTFDSININCKSLMN